MHSSLLFLGMSWPQRNFPPGLYYITMLYCTLLCCIVSYQHIIYAKPRFRARAPFGHVNAGTLAQLGVPKASGIGVRARLRWLRWLWWLWWLRWHCPACGTRLFGCIGRLHGAVGGFERLVGVGAGRLTAGPVAAHVPCPVLAEAKLCSGSPKSLMLHPVLCSWLGIWRPTDDASTTLMAANAYSWHTTHGKSLPHRAPPEIHPS